MKLKINGFDNEVIFNNENVNVLQILDTQCFSHIIEIINDKINGTESNEIFLLNDNNEEMNMGKELLLILDLFNIDYNSKKILNKLYDIISYNIEKNEDFEIESMTLKIREYLIQEINELPFEFTIKSELDICEILKLFNLKIDNSCYTNILQRIEMLIDIISTLKIASVLIVPNLKTFLSENELLDLYKYSLYNNVSLLLIEKSASQKLKYEKILVIDDNFDDMIL